ncbi:hypothetical protein [Paraliomyxa miuraensis]|uniref:hypothetical protein n=1 Tax=Paraliomyxa miuraensis TaxID=376150 RepID=UPI00225AD17B|nr:hypothetical protein [Paraliomyxa miuraensis]MCX4245002.1 hypothetical protein [Paraliomyxa miuraensis]
MSMTIMRSILAPALLAAALLPIPQAAASNYPPDYPTCGIDDYVTTGPFELIKETVDHGTHVRLTVAYRGYLRNWYADDEISLWIRLNGNDVFVPAAAGTHDDAYAFFDNGPRSCVWCANGQQGGYVPSPCEGITFPPYSSGQWVCSDPTPTEQYLFSWSHDQYGNQNAWDIDVAAEANGEWDSNWGNNFYGRFEPRNSCNY